MLYAYTLDWGPWGPLLRIDPRADYVQVSAFVVPAAVFVVGSLCVRFASARVSLALMGVLVVGFADRAHAHAHSYGEPCSKPKKCVILLNPRPDRSGTRPRGPR